jgi:2-dehydropantoate 2-reductase
MDAAYVVGAGGIGCALGYALRAAGVPVVFVEANPRKVVAGLREGDQVDGHVPLAADLWPSMDGSRLPGPQCSCTPDVSTMVRCWRGCRAG